MRALVTGGNGFIGSHLVDQLLIAGWDVTVLDLAHRRFDRIPDAVNFVQGDYSSEYLLRECAARSDVVFHLAWTGIHETSNRDPVADIQTNLVSSVCLLEICRSENVKRIVFLSSGGTVYGPAKALPISIDHPLEPNTSYGITKLAVEKYLKMYSHLHGLEYAILRPSVPFGPRQNPLAHQGAVAVFLYRVAHGLPITIFGDGQITRDFFYIEDLARAMVAAAICTLDTQRIFNIGGKEAVSLNQLLQEIEATLGKKAIVNYAEARPFDASHIKLDTQITEQCLQWLPQYSLSDGLSRTWAWMKATIPSPSTN